MKKGIIVCMLCLFCLLGCEKDSLTISEQYQYGYEQLEESYQEAYLQIYNALLHHEENVIITGIDKDMLEKLYVCVRNDHPELFWMDNKYSYSTMFNDTVIKVNFSYLMDQEKAKTVQQEIEKVKDECMAKLNSDFDDYQKVRTVYEFVIDRCAYVLEGDNDQNIVSVFLSGESVCAGYARAVQYLLLNMDMKCAYIEGYGNKESGESVRHAWNMVNINGDWYYLDATWGDQNGDITHVCDAYFLMNSDEMLQTYEPTSAYELTKEGHTYFEKKGNYFESWNVSQIQDLWKQARASNVSYIEMKCSEETYEDIVNRIAQKGEMYEILRQMGIFVDRMWYVKNDALCMIEIFY